MTPEDPASPAFDPDDSGGVRVRRLAIVVAVSFAALVAGLAYWQLARVDESNRLARRQTLRRQIEPAPRGTIFDRQHRVLAETVPSINVELDLGLARREIQEERDAPHRQAAAIAIARRHLARVNAITGRDARLDEAAFVRHLARDHATPFTLDENLSAAESARLASALAPAGPVRLRRSFRRSYPEKTSAVHVVGRLRQERSREADHPDFPTLNVMDLRGDSGLEAQWDEALRGRPGDRVVRLDVFGYVVEPPLEQHAAIRGRDLQLSLDLNLQLAAERAMAATPGLVRGAAVALEVATGEVLVMASAPGFDLNAVSPRLSGSAKQRIDAEGGWMNRATQGLYPAGSVFKLFTLLAGLREGSLRPDTPHRCPGYLEIGGRRFACHRAEGHGDLTLREALAQSCNVFAYRTGLAAGAGALAAEARRFHLDEPTRIDLPAETRAMLVPDPAWKQAEGRGAWMPGDTLNLAIGQGDLRISPLQAACAIASLARRETLTVPTLQRAPGRKPTGDRPVEPLGLSDGDYAALLDGLRAEVRLGTGRNAQVPGVTLAGKSGTAQVPRKEGMFNVAWFVAFAPADHPEIAIAVALEGPEPGMEFTGGAYAAPVAGEIAGAYFESHPRR